MNHLFHFLGIEPTADETIIRSAIEQAQQNHQDANTLAACRALLLHPARRRHYLYRLQIHHYDMLQAADSQPKLQKRHVFDPHTTSKWQKSLMLVLLLTSCLAVLPYLQQDTRTTPTWTLHIPTQQLENCDDIIPYLP